MGFTGAAVSILDDERSKEAIKSGIKGDELMALRISS